MEKKCKSCDITKDIDQYRKSKRHKDGYLKDCKFCMSIKRRKYYEENIDEEKNRNRIYYEENKGEINKSLDKDKRKINSSKYYYKNRAKLLENKRKYYQENKEEILEKRRKYYEENSEEINTPSERRNEIRRKSYKKRSYQYVWRNILDRTISQLKLEKPQTTMELLGYSYDDLKLHIESLFKVGMTWDNHGDWHVDHIIPISKFIEGTSPCIVNNLKNLTPIWKEENLKKGDSVEPNHPLIKEFNEYMIH